MTALAVPATDPVGDIFWHAVAFLGALPVLVTASKPCHFLFILPIMVVILHAAILGAFSSLDGVLLVLYLLWLLRSCLMHPCFQFCNFFFF